MREPRQRIYTTISKKHYSILKKYEEKYRTQAKTLELALELLNGKPLLSEEEQIWRIVYKTPRAVTINRDLLIRLFEVFLERNGGEQELRDLCTKSGYLCTLFLSILGKPVDQANLREAVDALYMLYNFSHFFERVSLREQDNFYELTLTHPGNKFYSMAFKIFTEIILKDLNLKIESRIEEHYLILKIYK
jgi:hypothetical protein